MTGFGYSYSTLASAAFWMRLAPDLGLVTGPLGVFWPSFKCDLPFLFFLFLFLLFLFLFFFYLSPFSLCLFCVCLVPLCAVAEALCFSFFASHMRDAASLGAVGTFF